MNHNGQKPSKPAFSLPVPWLLVSSPPADGAAHMALDEALLEACTTDPGAFRPVLRLYAFDPPCLSIGRFQSIATVDRDACRQRGIDIVRRPSGGRAVLHERCLTYALIAPADAPPFAGYVRASAVRIGTALAAGLRGLGAVAALAPVPPRGHHPADCFAVPGAGELVSDGRKLAGSAQVRRGRAALQHGTVRLRSEAGNAGPLLRAQAATPRFALPVALDELCRRPVAFDEAARAVAAGFAEIFAIRLEQGTIGCAEEIAAESLAMARYRSERWTAER